MPLRHRRQVFLANGNSGVYYVKAYALYQLSFLCKTSYYILEHTDLY